MVKIAIVGQPNVGKSSLFNRLLKQRVAVVSQTKGTTRDIKKRVVDILDKQAIVLDTGGVENIDDEIFSQVGKNSIKIANEADIILYMVDGKSLPTQFDKELFYKLQKLNKPIALIINKIDSDKLMENVWNFYEFGISESLIFPISVIHNRKINDLLYWLSYYIEKNDDEFLKEVILDDDSIKVAIIGRTNVGKSSILNALLGYERSVVSGVAGTTIDPVDDSIEYKNKKIMFIDTAGIRRRGKIVDLEKYALYRTRDSLKQAHIAILILDGSEELKELDEKIAGLCDEYRLGVIIAVNKWDKNIDEYKKIVKKIRDRFKFLYFAPVVVVSAKTKRNIDKLKDKILEVFDNFTKQIPTSFVNKLIEQAQIKHALPTTKSGKRLKIFFANQIDTAPPRFSLTMNRANELHFSYKRYLVNFFRENIDFEGVPIIFETQLKS